MLITFTEHANTADDIQKCRAPLTKLSVATNHANTHKTRTVKDMHSKDARQKELLDVSHNPPAMLGPRLLESCFQSVCQVEKVDGVSLK